MYPLHMICDTVPGILSEQGTQMDTRAKNEEGIKAKKKRQV